MAEQAGKPKRPNLRVAEWTDEQLAADAEVTPRDQQTAAEWFREHAPPGYRNLLDAVPEEPDA